ncbi:MAG: transcription elongation factor GreA [Eubacteriales bacterium]
MAKAKQMLYTKEGFQALQNELKERQTVKREEIKEAIALARSFGDLSENSEYDEARNEQAKNEARILELQAMIDNALIVDETKIDTSVISIGSSVRVYDNEYGEEVEYSIVGSNEVDPLTGKISDQSPIGRALMGKAAGVEISVETPSGTITMKILEVTRK